MNDYCYDIECYPNFFSCTITRISTMETWAFEISEWVNQGAELYQFLVLLQQINARLVGFNNVGYDYVLTHMLMVGRGILGCETLYAKSQGIFDKQNGGRKEMIWPDQRFVKQVDLFLIHHFNNVAKSTSLKLLEFNMLSDNIKDLPYDPRYPVTREQADHLLVYNKHDVTETIKFYNYSLPYIEFRDKLSIKYGRDFTNHNDTKIGKDYFIMELEKHGIQTKNNFTYRDIINVADVVFPYIKFEHPEFNRVLDFYKSAVLTEKDDNNNLNLVNALNISATINGFQFDLGVGGIHGSLKNTIVRESETHKLIDIDVASYYPNLAISNGLYPEHLSPKFCEIYLDVYLQRKGFSKKTPENAMLKLALNGVYGDSNSAYKGGKYSIFYDPKYTCSITINGQLLLCMLAEQLMKIPRFKMVQINTDGLTFLCPKEHTQHVDLLIKWWEDMTKLELESVDYEAMYISNVNNYMALKKDGGVKRIGCYAYVTSIEDPATRELVWNKNHSQRIVAKAAEAALVYNKPIPEFIRSHTNYMDFMLRTKVPRSSSLELHTQINWAGNRLCDQVTTLQNISRYYVSTAGGELKKRMPPLDAQIKLWNTCDHYKHVDNGKRDLVKRGGKPKSGKYKLCDKPSLECPDRVFAINKNMLVTDCSNIDDFDSSNINYDYYIEETRKIVDKLFDS